MAMHRLFFTFLFFLSFAFTETHASEVTVGSRSDFKSALTILKQEQKARYGAPFYSFSDSSLLYISAAEKWAKNEGNAKDATLIEIYHCFYLSSRNLYESFLPRGANLLNNPHLFEFPESKSLMVELAMAYDYNKQPREVLDLEPIIAELYDKYSGQTYLPQDRLLGLFGNAHFDLRQYPRAIAKWKSTIDEETNMQHAASTYNNIGLSYFQLSKFDSAYLAYQNALRTLTSEKAYTHMNAQYAKLKKNYSRAQHDSSAEEFKITIESNIADIYLKRGSPKRALTLYTKEVEQAKKKSFTSHLVMAYYKMADAHYHAKNTSIAIGYLDSMKTTMELLDKVRLSARQKYLMLKAKCHLALGQRQKASDYFDMEQLLSDSIQLAYKTNEFNSASSKYLEARRVNEQLKNENNMKFRETVSRYQSIGIIILSLLAMSLFLFLHRTTADKKLISEQKRIADKSLEEKELLLKEVHHRVKNNLQVISGLLSFQSNKLKNKEFNLLVQDSQKHIQSMSLVHQMLYQQNDFSSIQLKGYLENLTKHLLESRVEQNIDMHIEADDEMVQINKAIPIGLIITELVTNSLKHAFPKNKGNIYIYFRIKNKATLEYADDGIGLQDQKVLKNPTSTGTKLVSMLADELGAKYSVYVKEGVNYSFRFPLT